MDALTGRRCHIFQEEVKARPPPPGASSRGTDQGK